MSEVTPPSHGTHWRNLRWTKDFALRSPSHTYGKHRLCQYEDCTVTLSQYNPEDYCSVHWAQLVADEDARCMDEADMELALEYRQCAKCGERLPLTGLYFKRDKTLTSGYRRKCKLCENAEHTEHRHEKRDGKRVVVESMFHGRRITSVMEVDA
jgi:hypothetical protein